MCAHHGASVYRWSYFSRKREKIWKLLFFFSLANMTCMLSWGGEMPGWCETNGASSAFVVCTANILDGRGPWSLAARNGYLDPIVTSCWSTRGSGTESVSERDLYCSTRSISRISRTSPGHISSWRSSFTSYIRWIGLTASYCSIACGCCLAGCWGATNKNHNN